MNKFENAIRQGCGSLTACPNVIFNSIILIKSLKMQKTENVEVYIEDEEIIDVLSELPKMEDYDHLNILEFIQRKTAKSDFGTVMCVNNIIYTIYKFDNNLIAPEDAGLIMTKSSQEFAHEQLKIWKNFKGRGMTFSDKIFRIISDSLFAQQTIHQFHNRTK